MSNVILKRNCVFCGKEQSVTVDRSEYCNYESGMPIQRAMPTADTFTREFIIIGSCFDCQSKMYNVPKPGEDWGESRGHCPVCDCSLWEKDFTEEVAHCPSCHNETPREEIS